MGAAVCMSADLGQTTGRQALYEQSRAPGPLHAQCQVKPKSRPAAQPQPTLVEEEGREEVARDGLEV